MASKLQPSFTGGEADPRLYGRVDLAKYQSMVRTLRNWVVLPYGGIANRAGLEFIGFAGDESKAIRLAPFEASTDDTYVLEFGQGYIRFFRDGALVTSGGLPYQVATPYQEAHLFELQLQQSNDVVTITHELYEPRLLSRLDHANWTFGPIVTTETVSAPVISTVKQRNHVYQAGETDAEKNETYVVTTIDASNGRESLPSNESGVAIDLKWNGNTVRVKWATVPGALRYNVYKRKNGVYGSVGVGVPGTVDSDWEFLDDNVLPDSTRGIQQQKNPFFDGSHYPTTSAYYQQRRAFGGSIVYPNQLITTQSGDYSNFNTSFPTRDSDSIEFRLASRKIQKVLHLVSLDDLLVFTSTGEWRIRGAQDAVLTPGNIDARQQSEYGSSRLVPPFVVGDGIIFVQAKGQTVRSIAYDFSANKYKGENLTLLSAHLFEGRSIKQAAFALAPNSVAPFVMSDGTVLPFTYMPDQEVAGWGRMETQGVIESVTVVSEGAEDVAYYVVRRRLGNAQRRCIERQRSRRISDVQDSFFVDCGLSYDNPMSIGDIQLGPGAAVIVVLAAHGLIEGDTIDIADVYGGSTTNERGEISYFGFFDSQRRSLNTRFTVANPSTDAFQLRGRDGEIVLWGSGSVGGPGGFVRKAITTVTGLLHLEGEAVVGVANGALVGDEGELVVTGGAVTLQTAASRIHLGLYYSSEMETLDLDIGNASAIGSVKHIDDCMIHVHETRNLFFGQDLDGIMYQAAPRSDEPYYSPGSLQSGKVKAKFDGDWNKSGRVAFRAATLPATILAVAPRFEIGGTESDQER